MKAWRLNWTLKEFLRVDNFSKHSENLVSPWQYYRGLATKFFPSFSKAPIQLNLKKGGSFDVHDFMTLFIYKEIFVDACYDLPKLTVDEPVIINIGANTGLFDIRMKQLYPEAKIYAYEPFPSNFAQLKKNISMSKLKNVNMFMKGIGAVARKEKLFIHTKNLGGHSIYKAGANSNNYVEIELIDLQSAMNLIKGGTCNLLKADCEGAEYEILKSITSEMASKINYIVYEPSPKLYDLNDLNQHLIGLGYELKANNGLLIACRNK